MQYYSVAHSLNKKVLGNDPQVKDVISNCDIWATPYFIDNFPFQKIEIEPVIVNPVLYSKTKLTDLIYTWSMGFTYTKLISGKLKSILERNRSHGMQFFQCSIFKDGIEYNDYWILNIFEIDNQIIDIKNSRIIIRKKKPDGGTIPTLLKLESLDEFNIEIEKAKEAMEIIYIEKLSLDNSIISEDFFLLRRVEGGVKYVVSEKLKKEIEDAGCTGIEFQPIELSLNEWLAPDGEREKVYGKSI